MSKKENLVELPLDEILKKHGYYEKREKSSWNFKTFTNEFNDTIVISRQPNGHYLYFNPNEEADRGNIYSFAKNRGIKVNDLININNKTEIKELQEHIIPKTTIEKSNKEIIANYKKLDSIGKKSFLNGVRKIGDEIIQNFGNLKQDEKYGNLIVPTYTLKQIQTTKIQSILSQSGTISYLKQPITKDTNGKPYNKPIKQLCNGVKGLEIIKADNSSKNLKDFKNIIVCESMIDALSFVEMKGLDLNTTLLTSTNGQVTHSQKEALRWLNEKSSNAEIILGFDNDNKGKEFVKLVEKITPNASRAEPILKDFNDDLIVGKTLKINPQNISKETIVKALKEFESKVSYLDKKYEILESNAREKRIKELFACDLSSMKKIEPKVENLKDLIDLTAVFKRLSNVEKKIERDYSLSR